MRRPCVQMRKNNEVESPDPWLYGRHLKDYRDLGFLSTNVRKNCVSRHMEYAYQDWCISTLAGHLGQQDVANATSTARGRYGNYGATTSAASPRASPDGSWVNPFNPDKTLPDAWNDPYFYEGTSTQWSFNVQHDFAGLIARHGGNVAFVRHLDDFFDSGRYHSKETMLHIPWLYNYAGRPDKTADRVRWAMGKFFNTSRLGLSDNEDMGCQSAFYMCSAMGLYPIMGQDLYLLTSPSFTRTQIALGTTGRPLVIESPDASPDRPYIVSATLDGKPLNRCWLRHHEIADGATLTLDVAANPGRLGPPSRLLLRLPRNDHAIRRCTHPRPGTPGRGQGEGTWSGE